jgi:antitoxin HicB
MLEYPVTLTQDTNGAILMGCPDLPEANSVGDDEDEALLNAQDAIESALEIYFDEHRPVPLPSTPAAHQPVVTLPALITAKVLLWNEMLAQGVRKAELARRLGWRMPQVEHLLDLRHGSRIEQIEAALARLNRRLDVSVTRAT